MEENMNYIFEEKVGDVKCKFDGRLWSFEDKSAKEDMVIPVKSISNVHVAKNRSWFWLVILILAILIAVAGGYLYSNAQEGVEFYFGLAIVLVIIAILVFIFSVEYTLSIVPHSGIAQEVVTRRKNALTNLYDALVNSLRINS